MESPTQTSRLPKDNTVHWSVDSKHHIRWHGNAKRGFQDPIVIYLEVKKSRKKHLVLCTKHFSKFL